MCSGTDSPIAVLKTLAKALHGRLVVEHTFSCENDTRKQKWIKQNFPDLRLLFDDVKVLHIGRAYSIVTGEVEDVPQVDIVIAGFVCKSVSTQNADRDLYADCINDETGMTGETFSGVMKYVKKYKPAMVICENVLGLIHRNGGRPAVIHNVKASFNKAGYAFGHQKLDTRSYLLPQRRNRVWMYAFRGTENEQAILHTSSCISALASKDFFSLDELFRMADIATPPCRVPLPREQICVVNAVQRADRAKQRKGTPYEDIVVDLGQGVERAPYCSDGAPCIVPNGKPYRVNKGYVLSAEQVLCCQGVYREDFPALPRWAKEERTVARDLAGNAFSTTVCMAVMIACLACAPIF